jgi:hypothetical protein
VEALDGAHLENRLDPQGLYIADAGPSGATPTTLPAGSAPRAAPASAATSLLRCLPLAEDTQWRCADVLVRCLRHEYSARPCDGRHRLVAPETRGEWQQPRRPPCCVSTCFYRQSARECVCVRTHITAHGCCVDVSM